MRRPTGTIPARRIWLVLACLCGWLTLTAACTTPVSEGEAIIERATPLALAVTADGETRQITTTAATVGDALAEANISLSPFDEVDPPRGASLTGDGATMPQTITIVRVTEALEVIPESVPYERRIVRSAEMAPDDPPRLLQTGVAGLRETSYRIVFHDGLEVERWPTASTIIESPVDEIVMIGVGGEETAMRIEGRLAYNSGGRAIFLTGSTDSARQLPIEEPLDGRVFQLSPSGNYLLYTVRRDEGAGRAEFRNELWVIPTAEGGQPWSLGIENVLWAGWDPAALEPLRIAYTTARSVATPPGWEANNDLWLMEIAPDETQLAPVRLVGTTAAAFGWWGGTYAWSPAGGQLAYAFADEVGMLEIPSTIGENAAGLPDAAEPPRTALHTFPAYDTGADWAWIPALSWSADGGALAFTTHAGEGRFNLMVAETVTGETSEVITDVGIWAAVYGSPAAGSDDRQLAVVRAEEPSDGEDGDYVLWLVGEDGANEQRVFPPEGERGAFDRASQSVAWGPDGNAIAFIFDGELHILNLATDELYRSGLDDTTGSHPTWAPYGAAAGR